MDRIVIRGGQPLHGRIPISGAKNAALTLLPCALLTDEPLTLRNLPRLADVDSFGHLLNQLGVSTTVEGARPDEFGRVMTLRAANLTSTVAAYDIVRKMRASILVLGPLVGRAGEATVSVPGGCAIGITGGSLELVRARKETMPSILSGLTDAGLVVEELPEGLRVSANGGLRPLSISTAPYPAFPTDMQAQFMAMLTLAEGTSLLT